MDDRSLIHQHVTWKDEVTAGLGKLLRIPMHIRSGYAARIMHIWFDVVGSSMIQAVSIDPEGIGLISNYTGPTAPWTRRDIVAFSSDETSRAFDYRPGFLVVRDLVYMIDITFTGTLPYGVHVWWLNERIDETAEAGLLLQNR